MSLTDLIVSQFADPFRIVLLIGLLYTALRTSAVSGLVVPLIAGVVFVAVLIPTTLKPAGDQVIVHVGVGMLVNAVILGLLLAAKAMWDRRKGG